MQTSRLFAGSFLAALFLLPALCPAQTISMVSGNGQLVCPDCAGGPYKYAPLVVQVYNSNGTPAAANTSVTWVATQQGVAPVTATSLTNSTGQASYTFTGLAFFFGFNFLPATVVASVTDLPSASVTFVETTALPSGGAPAAFASLSSSTGAPPNLSGAVGSTSTTTITISVYTFSGAIPGVSVALVPVSATGPSVTCAPQPGQPAGSQPGIVLTSSSGSATCTPVFGGSIGTGQYTVVVGGKLATFGPSTLTVTAGAPAAIKYISGNNQNANPGVVAPLALTAEVTDSGGNPSNGAAVQWSVTPTGAATLTSEVTVSPSTGLVSTRVTPTAPAQVTVSLANNSAVHYTFAVNVNIVVTALQYSSGNSQLAAQGAAFADPLIVQVNDNGQPVDNATVNFAVTSGSAMLSSSTAVSNAQGYAQVIATAGATPGPVAVTASIVSSGKTYSYSFALTVIPPGPVISSLVNSAGTTPQAASPCSLATIYGTGLADNLQGVVTPLIAPQTQVAGVTVQFGANLYAPILYVANINGQEAVSLQVPCSAPVGTAVPMIVTVDGVSSTLDVAITPYSPGIFQFTDYDGQTRAVLISAADGTLVTVGNSATGVSPNPAYPGSTYRMFVTGLGQTSPPLVTGELDPLVTDSSGNLTPQDLPVLANLLVGVNGGGVTIVAARYAYGMVGVYEVDFVMPASGPNNNAPLDIVAYQSPTQPTPQLFWGNESFIVVQ